MLKLKCYSALPLLAAALLLTGCTSSVKSPKPAYLVSAPPSLTQQIQMHGVQIIQQGTKLQLILPTDQFFQLQTIQLRANQLITMDLIAAYLQRYLQDHHTTGVVTVSGYTDNIFNRPKRDKLSSKYAQVIASYLWNKGFSQRQLQVYGFGDTHPIANQNTTLGRGLNRRVVIEINP